jgi:hypothetical protein
MVGKWSLRYALSHYLAPYHPERNHQGPGNRLIALELTPTSRSSPVKRRARLDGLLTYYCRDMA